MVNHISNVSFNNQKGQNNIYYVHRSTAVINTLIAFWNKGSGIKDKSTMEGASVSQKTVNATNVLFRNLERFGPVRSEFQNYKYDRKKELHHAHTWHTNKGGNTFVVMWEVDEDRKIINIVRMDFHENFNFSRSHNKENRMKELENIRDQKIKCQKKCAFAKYRTK